MTSVFIVEDHAVVIEGIYSLLSHEKDIRITGYATSAKICLDFLPKGDADVILMDINLPDMSGVELCKVIKSRYPAIMVLALTSFDQGSYVRKMMGNGASGYLLKNAAKEEVIEAIHTVSLGRQYISPQASQALKSELKQQKELPQLTKREKEILGLIASGMTNPQISEKLFISVDTVDSHRKNLYTKLRINNTALLVRFAIENNLL
ncbi:MAG: response regulator transcription factor [Chitinophagaceae bacterium]|nr:MAG: response regulator transcription factor [Chitinophagaceae bacterium]